MWQHNVVLNDSSENSSSIQNCQIINLNTQMEVEIPTNENIKMRSKNRNQNTAVNYKKQKMYHQKPINALKEKSLIWNVAIETQEYAKMMDQEDQFSSFRNYFSFPKKKDLPHTDLSNIYDENEDCLYLCGQSLGLKPKSLDNYVKEVLDNWAHKGVHSHFHGYLPAALSDLPAKEPMSRIVGCKPHEVAIMNALTVNLHILMTTFYKPTQNRHKILIEEHAFSSDMYAVKSQISLHGYSPETSLVTLKPRQGEHLLREKDILELIDQKGDEIAMALLPLVQYYTGQLLNVEVFTKACQKKGIIVGVDCAHAVGNVPMNLHNWNVDFGAWCTYKYLNSGAGSIGGIFVHEKWIHQGVSENFPMLKGWWGNSMKTKFLMKDEFDPCYGADMFKISNPSPILNAMLMASLDIFSQTSIEELRKKQFLLTGYLEYLITTFFPSKINKGFVKDGINNHGHEMPSVEIITPSNPAQRGAQLSLTFSVPLAAVQEELQKRGVVCDIRMPSVMRVAPVPIYNTFTDVYKFVITLHDVFKKLDGKWETFNNKVITEGSDVIENDDQNSQNAMSISNGSSPINCNSSDSEADSHYGTFTL